MTGPVVVVDTSGLVAGIDRGSESHEATRTLLDELRTDRDARLLVLAFRSRRGGLPDLRKAGSPGQGGTALLEDVARGAYRLERAVEVMRRYADLGVGLADASNIVLAERHGVLKVLTLDERHFRVLRGPGGEPFRLLPTDR